VAGGAHGRSTNAGCRITARQPRAPSSAWDDIQPFIDGLDEQAAFVSKDGIILAVNRHWRRQVERQARYGLHISRDYDAYLAELLAQGDEAVRPILEAFRSICRGSSDSFHCLYKGSGAFSGYDFKVVITAMSVHGDRYILVTVHDVTELASLKRQRRRLGSQLLRAQEAERRRVARDVHDSTSQALVSLQLSITKLSRELLGASGEALVKECQEAIQEVHREIRALSFIAHPPSTASAGLKEALESLVAGFAERTGVGIEIECPELPPRSSSVEATIFRLTQEALANIHRHASAAHASVRLIARSRHLHLLIWDDGIGFEWPQKSARRSMGVGVPGMAERVRELGGRLSLIRLEKGTLMRASLPRTKSDPAHA
jgi:signal transduction histidine kinase